VPARWRLSYPRVQSHVALQRLPCHLLRALDTLEVDWRRLLPEGACLAVLRCHGRRRAARSPQSPQASRKDALFHPHESSLTRLFTRPHVLLSPHTQRLAQIAYSAVSMKKLVLCALFASCVHAYSTGGNTGSDDSEAQSCDAIDICVGGICPEGMDKVGAPSRSAAYNVRTGTGPDPMQDATGECADLERDGRRAEERGARA
jgi:hypothetical protein